MEVRIFHEDGTSAGGPEGSWMMSVHVKGQHANHRKKQRPGLTLEEKGRSLELYHGLTSSPPKAVAMDLSMSRRSNGNRTPVSAEQVRNYIKKKTKAKRSGNAPAHLASDRLRERRPGSSFEYDPMLLASASYSRQADVPACSVANIAKAVAVCSTASSDLASSDLVLT